MLHKNQRFIRFIVAMVILSFMIPSSAFGSSEPASDPGSQQALIPKQPTAGDPQQNRFFETSSSAMTTLANMYWAIYGVDEYSSPGNDIHGSRYGANPAWTEWDSMKFSWTGYSDYRNHVKQYLKRGVKINGYNTTGVQPDGYIWSWGTQETWPDGGAANHNGVGSFHYDQIPRYISAIYNMYMWTRDDAYLDKVLPKAEFVMDHYLLQTMKGDSGVLSIPDASNDGTPGSRPSNYWDQALFGYQDAWVNESFYTALKNMAVLEQVKSNTKKQEKYQQLANAFPARYDSVFWNSVTNRYIGWKDANGEAHDYGFTYINTEALTRGLGNTDKAYRILDWLDSNTAQPTVGGAHVSSTDVYQLIVAPRTNTVALPLNYMDGWSNPPTGPRPYGEGLPDGGAVLWSSYYDIMARLKYIDADNAYTRFKDMLNRVDSESKKLTFDPGKGRFYNDFGESIVEIGTNDPFPESGIAMLPYIQGFIGANADINGLNISPNLPSSLQYAEAKQVNYGGKNMTVKVSSEQVTDKQENYNAEVKLEQGDMAAQTFQPSANFNEIGLYIEPYQTPEARFTVALEKQVNGKWLQVASRYYNHAANTDWVYMAVPDQQADGSPYRICVYSDADTAAWYFNNGSNADSGAASLNETALNGAFVYRVIESKQKPVLQQQGQANTVDKEHHPLAQVITSDVPFNRIGMMVDLPSNGKTSFTASLYQYADGQWRKKTEQTYRNINGNQNSNEADAAEGKSQPMEEMLSFATQQPGKYKVEINDQAGAVGWYRNAKAAAQSGFEALVNGKPIAGQREYTVYRGQYGIEIPELQVNTTIDAGDTYTIKKVVPDPSAPEPPMQIPEPLTSGSTLGQSFASETTFNALVLNTPTWTNKDSGYTVTLKKDSPAGETVFTTGIRNAVDGNNMVLVGTQQPGTYYVEISNPIKSIGWWTVEDVRSDGSAYQNGNPILDEDRLMEVKYIQ